MEQQEKNKVSLVIFINNEEMKNEWTRCSF